MTVKPCNILAVGAHKLE